jgi:hypothetical protein
LNEIALRLGGYFDRDDTERGNDSKGSKCSCAMAGFGITDDEFMGPYFAQGKRSFGIRYWSEHEQIAKGAVVYGK